MTTAAIPMPAGAVPADESQSGALPTIPSGERPAGNQPVPMPAGAVSADTPEAAPEMVSQGRDRFGNEIKIPKEDTLGSMVGPLAIPVTAAGIALAPGALLEAHAALAAGIKALPAALITGVTAVGEWAAAHPVAAKAILETLKMAAAGTIAGKVAGGAKKVINASE